jgi:tetrapyrrole methylase family protein/MazG family protein
MPLTVVGLGPGPAGWLTRDGEAALRQPNARVFARTRLHPALDALSDHVRIDSFDALYASAATLDAVYDEMSARLVAELEAGARPVILAVPGDGVVGEELLVRLHAADVRLAIVPGVPITPAVLAAVDQPLVAGVQTVEASALGGSGIELQIELNPHWPAVVVGIFNRAVAGEVKLALLPVYPPEHLVQVVRHPGLADAQHAAVPLAELDRVGLELDHLTHLLLPAVPTAVPTGSAHGLRALVARLRAPEIGCPWDLKQTHRSLVPYAIEEAYEVVDAIEDGTPGELADELGDLLLQVALHAEIADQEGEFDWNDVVRGLSAKLIRRHPHVFGTTEVADAEDVVRNWDALKAAEPGRVPKPESRLDGVARSLPALRQAAELARRASAAGFDWPTRAGTLSKVREELDELLAADPLDERREELGDLLYILAKLAVQDGIDPEEALRAANGKFTRRFLQVEAIARERGWPDLASRPVADLEAAWAEAKRRTALPSRTSD